MPPAARGTRARLRHPRRIVSRPHGTTRFKPLTGWEQHGPLASTAGHDIDYIAVTGPLAAIGPADALVPPLNLVGDYGGGALFLVAAMLAAFLHAGRTGTGQVVDAATCDGTASLMAMFYDFHAQDRWTDGRAANLLDGGAPFYRTYACKDGRFLAVGALEPQFYALLCERAGLPPTGRDDPADWPAAVALLPALREEGEDHVRDLVFGGGKGGTHAAWAEQRATKYAKSVKHGEDSFSAWSRSKDRLDGRIAKVNGSKDKPIPLPRWTLHDLRRTFVTGTNNLGVEPHVVEAAVNHVSGDAKGGVAGIYNRSRYTPQVRAAMKVWADHVAAVVAAVPAAVEMEEQAEAA